MGIRLENALHMSAQIAPDIILETIQFLEQQKSRGVRHLRLDPQLLEGWQKSSASPARATTVATASAKPRPTTQAPRKTNRKAPMSADQRASFEGLRTRALECTRCPHLASSRKQVVFGIGNPDAELMFIGEAPGADEDQQGEPFVGRAGQLLTKMIQAMGYERADIYIANILKCRPNVDTPSDNRKPTSEEMATCIPYLKEQIKLIKPLVLVGVGDTAVKGLLPELKEGITKLRGHWLEYEGIPLMPTFHPAYLLHNQSLALKRQCWEDMLAVMERLDLSISEKQRNYFLSAISGQPSS